MDSHSDFVNPAETAQIPYDTTTQTIHTNGNTENSHHSRSDSFVSLYPAEWNTAFPAMYSKQQLVVINETQYVQYSDSPNLYRYS